MPFKDALVELGSLLKFDSLDSQSWATINAELGENPSSSSESILKGMCDTLDYPLAAGGKRVRPLLCIGLAQALGSQTSLQNALQAAAALEMVHTYSLVHDDLPCMDDDDLRRGKPTVHKVYGEAKAVLAGDALLTEAFAKLANLQPVHNPALVAMAVRTLAKASGHEGMIGGQWLDIEFEKSSEKAELSGVMTTHALKTGCLLGASLELGALCGLNESELSAQSLTQLRESAWEAGVHLGLAFQLIDDILDETASSEELGKTAGKDLDTNKKTAVAALGLEATQKLADGITEKAKGTITHLFEKVPATDEHSRVARQALLAQMDALLSRRN